MTCRPAKKSRPSASPDVLLGDCSYFWWVPMTLDSLVNELPKSYTPQDIALVRRAFEVAATAHEGQLRKSGEAYIEHPLAVARILANLRSGLAHDRRGAAARRGRRHADEGAGSGRGVRGGGRQPGGWRHQAGRHRRDGQPPARQPRSQGRKPPQDAAGDGRRRARRAHQAGGSPPQHADARLHAPGEAAPHLA